MNLFTKQTRNALFEECKEKILKAKDVDDDTFTAAGLIIAIGVDQRMWRPMRSIAWFVDMLRTYFLARTVGDLTTDERKSVNEN